MDRFLSNAINRIDAKGRVSVPAHFRAVLGKRGYAQLYALRALDTPAMEVGGPDLLERLEARIAQEDPFGPLADDLLLHCYGDAVFLKIDPDGRITMTDFIRAHTGIAEEVAFVGKGLSFEIWEPDRFRLHAEAARDRLKRLRLAAASRIGVSE